MPIVLLKSDEREIERERDLILLHDTRLSSESTGVAIPYPFESRLEPTFMVLHGFWLFMYSLVVDSTR